MAEAANVKTPRLPIPRPLQVEVFRRDGWLCRWCGMPVIFSPAMRYLETAMRDWGWTGPLAYFHDTWTRYHAPLIARLGAVIDHLVPLASGGLSVDKDNLVTSCYHCNATKNSSEAGEWSKRQPDPVSKGKYGHPEHWDGLSSLFIAVARRFPQEITKAEAEWFNALNRGPV